MKSNIDLTNNEIFSKQSFNKRLSSDFLRILGEKFPWEVYFSPVQSNNDLSPELQLVLTGCREDRQSKRICKKVADGDFCVCCGIDLRRFPWDRTYDLCKVCEYHLNKNIKKNKRPLPWRIKNNSRIDNPLLW